MKVKIRQESKADHAVVFDIVTAAFKTMEKSNHKEQFLVQDLRNNEDIFIPELSLVAELENKLVGHVLISKVKIIDQKMHHSILSLAPVSVLPSFQRQGIGTQLIKEGHRVAKSLGFNAVILIGHESYYPRFGYKPAHQFGIEFPFDSPKVNCMAIELNENALKEIKGMVEYPKEFFA